MLDYLASTFPAHTETVNPPNEPSPEQTDNQHPAPRMRTPPEAVVPRYSLNRTLLMLHPERKKARRGYRAGFFDLVSCGLSGDDSWLGHPTRKPSTH